MGSVEIVGVVATMVPISIRVVFLCLLPLALSVPVYPGNSSGVYVRRAAMPAPPEFWLCASDFNPFNLFISQPITRERCEVIPRGATAAAQSEDESQSMPQIQYFPFG